MSATTCPPRGGRDPAVPRPSPVRTASLRGRLRELGRDPSAVDPAAAACLVWVAGVLVEIAGEVGDARSAVVLVDEASAVLAAVPDGHADGGPAPAVAPSAPLTGRELVVLRELQADVPLRQVADNLFVSYNTVKSQSRAVYRKLGVRSRPEALRRARELRLI